MLILVKALPRVGNKHGETVCCAGITLEGARKRLYPIRFRHLTQDKKFARWQWVTYDWRPPSDDVRPESQRVIENTIVSGKVMPNRDRERFLEKIIMPSQNEAAARGHTLTLIRPKKSSFKWRKKTASEIVSEQQEYIRAAQQKDFFDKELQHLTPCPYEFRFEYELDDGRTHRNLCLDWEISATYFRFAKNSGESAALEYLDKTFNQDYPQKGMAFALGTDSRHPKSWLLVGIIRLDKSGQIPLI